MSSHSPAHRSDKAAGFTGLIAGAIFVGVVLFGVVKLTNAHYNNEKASESTAQHAK